MFAAPYGKTIQEQHGLTKYARVRLSFLSLCTIYVNSVLVVFSYPPSSKLQSISSARHHIAMSISGT